MAPSASKYKLFASSGDGDNDKKPCAFFNSPGGCRNGDNCKFLHSAGSATPPPFQTANNNSVVSTEESSVSSESDAEPMQATTMAPAPTPNWTARKREVPPPAPSQPHDEGKPKKKRKRKKSEKHSQVFVKPKGSDSKAESKNKVRYSDLLYDEPADRDEKKFNVSALPPSTIPTPMPSLTNLRARQEYDERQAQKKNSATSYSSAPSFRNLNLPVASFSVASSNNNNSNKEAKPVVKSEPQETVASPSPPTTPKPQVKASYPLPDATEVGRKWRELVIESQSHPKFASSFDFSRYKDKDIPGDTWIRSKPFGEWSKDCPQAIAIDCEMCETTDPVSGQKNPNALCRLSVVNAENPDDVLIDTLVKPAWPVTDYRTWVNGISATDLEPVQFTLRHAQAFMVALCSEQTVILGHSVQNDLAALRMEHYCVADSAFLFEAKDSPTATVSLKDLAKSILKKDMPETHDSVNDARTALACVEHYRVNGGQVLDVVRSTPSNQNMEGRSHHKLFVHRIPKVCNANHLAKMFLEHTSIAPDEVEDIEFKGSKGKTMVVFKTAKHASLAFETLEGSTDKDASGRLQKKMFLRDGDYVRIRKNVFEYGHVFPDGKVASSRNK